MGIRYPEVGVCGLSCRLCPHFHTAGASRCTGCKGESRMAAGCPFITCAVKRKGVEFCWQCAESPVCDRWAAHRAAGRERDSFVSYAALEDNIAFIERGGMEAFVVEQRMREDLLRELLAGFSEGRSKTFFSVAVTVLGTEQVRTAIEEARLEAGPGADLRTRARVVRARLESAASTAGVRLALRR